MSYHHGMNATPERITLAAQGPALSPIVAGAWRMADWGFSVQQRLRWIEQWVELGISSFDHADIYGDYRVEALFGEALAVRPDLRAQIQIVSKCGIKLQSAQRPQHRMKSYDTSRAHVLASVEQSLRRLGSDHLDLLLIHRPDVLMDPWELAQTFDDLKSAGKVLHVGVSNHAPSQLALLHAHHRVATNQVEMSPLHLEALSNGTLDQCLALGLRPMAWSPLGGGRLFSGKDPQAVRVREQLEVLAAPRGASVATMAYAWLLRHPSKPVPIAGSSRVEGMRDAVASLDVSLSGEDWYSVWQASTGHAVP